MYTSLFKSIILPAVDLYLHTSVGRLWKFFDTTQWWSLDQLQAWQDERLACLIAHAYNNVPYYQRVMHERGLRPADIVCVNDLIKLPILAKSIVRQEREALISQNIDPQRIKLNSTGGTTGEPLQYYGDWEAWSADLACLYRGWGFAGYRPGDRMATLAGSSLVPDQRTSLTQRIRLRLERNLPLSVIALSADRSREYAGQLAAFRPQYLRGYPTALYVFARHVRSMNLKLPGFKAAFTTAEVLQPQHRTVIEEVLNCPVFDGYGCRDGGANAMECDHHRGMHLSPERAIVEFLDDAGNRTSGGRMILTDLFNYSMPFIRYEVDDVGELGQTLCSCGRGLPLLARLEGRTTDILTFGNGTTLSGPAATLIFRKTSFLQYHLCQKNRYTLIVRYVPGDPERNNVDVGETHRLLQHHLGPEISVQFEQVDDIPPTNAGKRRFIVSEAGACSDKAVRS